MILVPRWSDDRSPTAERYGYALNKGIETLKPWRGLPAVLPVLKNARFDKQGQFQPNETV